jgi:hypothetical protein
LHNYLKRSQRFHYENTLLFYPGLIPVFASGQATNHFDRPDARWHVARTFSAANPQDTDFNATTTRIYGYHGDSLHGGMSWHKLYSSYDPAFVGNLVYEGLIRTDNELVLFTDTLNALDTLYDFSLGADDYVLYPFYNNQYYTWIDHLDSIELNGAFFGTYHFDEPFALPSFFDYVGERWIEGIGSIHGPLFPHRPRTFSGEVSGDSLILTCSYANGQFFWQHPSYEDCYTQIVWGTDDKLLPGIDLYPNPSTGSVTLDLPENGTFEMIVTSETGQVLFRQQVVSGVAVDLSFLSAGMYITLLSNGSQILAGKLAKL